LGDLGGEGEEPVAGITEDELGDKGLGLGLLVD